jgi:hypothetical protein
MTKEQAICTWDYILYSTKYMCNRCGIVEGKVYFDKDLDCDLCEDCINEEE